MTYGKDRPGRRLHDPERVPQDSRKDVGATRCTGRASGGRLSGTVHDAAVPHAREQHRERELRPSTVVRKSTPDALTTWRGRKVTASKAWRSCRSVTSPSAPPSR